MNRRLIASTLLVAASLLSAQAVYAAPVSVHAPVNAFFHGNNLVKFNVRNDSATEIKLKAADSEVTIAPGKTVEMKAALGTQVISVSGSTMEAGSVVSTVSDTLKGNTLVIR